MPARVLLNFLPQIYRCSRDSSLAVSGCGVTFDFYRGPLAKLTQGSALGAALKPEP